MISSVSSSGVRVEQVYPSPYMVNVNVNSEIKVIFNSELNTATIINSFVVLKDKYMGYRNEDSLKRLQDFEVVEGNLSYKNKTIFFKPSNPLSLNSRYVICIRKNSIIDFVGNKMVTSYYSTFITESTETIGPCSFISPIPNTLYKNIPVFSWDNKQVNYYIFQISKQTTFETLYCEEYVDCSNVVNTSNAPSYEPNVVLDEGLYYARVKALCGEWSEPLQFFLKPVLNGDIQTQIDEVQNDDITENNTLVDLLNQVSGTHEIEVLEMYPNDNTFEVDTKLNCVYIKVRGYVTENDIDFDLSYLEGFLYDEDNGDMDTGTGIINGSWDFVYNDIEDATYIIFVIGDNSVKG